MTVPVIAIDGPAASGKGTIAQRAADALGWHYLDSGALYRLAALAALRAKVSFDDPAALTTAAQSLAPQFKDGRIWLDGEDVSEAIRAETVGVAASKCAAVPGVRQALFDLQRRAAAAPGLVADGRDMGTVVFPEAKLKIFMTASARVRAERRVKQLAVKKPIWPLLPGIWKSAIGVTANARWRRLNRPQMPGCWTLPKWESTKSLKKCLVGGPSSIKLL